MASQRDAIEELLAGLIDFGSIEGTAAGDNDGIEATIRGVDDGAGGEEERAGCELWGAAPLQFRPLAGTEVVMLRRGDEIVGLATKDRRVAVVLEEGEAVLTNLRTGGDAARVRLRADGEVWIEAKALRAMAAGSDETAATKALALAEETKARLDSIQSTFDGHIHTATTTATVGTGPVGTVTVAAPTSTIGSLAPIASERVFTES